MNHPTPPTPHRQHLAGDHTACRPSWCLAARADRQAAELSATPDQLQQTRDAGGADFPQEPACTVCGVTVEYVARHPDGRSGGWRHRADHGGEPHTAFPQETAELGPVTGYDYDIPADVQPGGES